MEVQCTCVACGDPVIEESTNEEPDPDPIAVCKDCWLAWSTVDLYLGESDGTT